MARGITIPCHCGFICLRKAVAMNRSASGVVMTNRPLSHVPEQYVRNASRLHAIAAHVIH